MADLTAALRDHLEADATITAVVGTRIRVGQARTSDRRDSNKKPRAYIVISEITDEPEQHIGGGSDIARAEVQIACYGTNRATTRALSDLVYTSLNGRPAAVMGDDDLEVQAVRLKNRRMLDEGPTDASEIGTFKDVWELTGTYAIDATP